MRQVMKGRERTHGVVSSIFRVQSHFELVSLVLALEATDLVSEPEPVTQMTVELINNHLISVQYSKRDECKRYNLFHLKTITNRF